MMGKSGNNTDSSRAVDGIGSNSVICKDSVRSAHQSWPQSSDSNEKFIMVGRIQVSITKWISTNGQSHSSLSKPIVNRRNPSIVSMSNYLPSLRTTTDPENTNLCSNQTKVYTHEVLSSSSSSESNGLNYDERSQARKAERHCHWDSSLPSNFGKKKRVAYGNRPRAAHRKSDYALADQKSGSLYNKPFDICLSARVRQDSSGWDVSIHPNYVSCSEVLRPGMVLLKHYINHNKQVELVKICRELGKGPGGFYRPGYNGGAKLRLQMMCLGLDWDPQTRKYGKKRSTDGSEPPDIPLEFSMLAKTAIEEAQYLSFEKYRVSNVEEEILPSMSPDICIVNFYSAYGRLGLHQDRDESRESLHKGLPVVSFSLGDSAEFLYGDERDVEKAEKVVLESGDVLIFGGESRLVFHGVSSIVPNSAPKELLQDTGLRPGRLNLTFRQF